MPRAQREQRMLDAAGEAFARDGFHEASMDAIAHAAGISKPMLYNYFGSKEGLYVAYVRRSGRTLLQKMREAAPVDASTERRLRLGILAFLTYVEEHGAGWAVLHHETTTQGGPIARQVAELREQIAGMLSGLFGGRDAFAHAFVGAGESLAGWWLSHPERTKEEVAALLVDIAGLGLADSEASARAPR
ncbi:MAG: TetR/AcrR family transcriptional regulator [Solirubrobacteraceae bacterium]